MKYFFFIFLAVLAMAGLVYHHTDKIDERMMVTDKTAKVIQIDTARLDRIDSLLNILVTEVVK